MKLSVFKGDEGYENYLAHRPVVVYVNGEVLNNVVRLDSDKGWAEFNVKDDDGLFLIENGEIVTDIAEGLVELQGDGIELEQPEPETPVDPEPLPEEESEEDA